MTAFPSIAPTARTYDGGDWPVKTYKAQSGYEYRFLYGNRRTDYKLSLSYNNIPDTTAEQFFQHYYEQNGTYKTFDLPAATSVARGWSGYPLFFNAETGLRYRYASPPQLVGQRPGISSVTIELIAVAAEI